MNKRQSEAENISLEANRRQSEETKKRSKKKSRQAAASVFPGKPTSKDTMSKKGHK
jgi:hypothetical protein